MVEISARAKESKGISNLELKELLSKSIRDTGKELRKVLIIPPDFTRMYSGAGKITEFYYDMLKDWCEVDIMPALGTHEPMTEEECRAFFGSGVPFSSVIAHNWRSDVVKIGEVPGDFVQEVSQGILCSPIDVEVNKRLLDPTYDLILSIGQVVPHEVVGMANYSKNIFVGCGGSNMISKSHMLGAFYGMERLMGRDHSPVRKVFDYAEEHFIANIPLLYVLTVTTQDEDQAAIHGLYIGRSRKLFEEAVALSQEMNITFVDKPLSKVVVYLDEREFKSTWLGNKSVYRTRMAIKEGGELIVIAPGVKKFGEDEENDRVIRQFGYIGRSNVLELCQSDAEMQNNLSVAAHLIHGSADGKFSITYAVEKLTKEEIEGVNFKYIPLSEALDQYPLKDLKEGYNTLNGEEIYYIGNPALGLWACRDLFR